MIETSKTNFAKQYETSVESSIWIERPPEAIWNYLADVSNDPQWRDVMIEARWTSDPPHGVGSTGINVVKGVGDWPWKVTEWEELRSTAWDVTGGRFEGSQGGYRISPEDSGTHVTLHAQFESSAFKRFVMPFFRRLVRRQFAADLTKLKAVMEA